MNLLLKAFAIFELVTVVHVLSLAMTARLFGIPIREIAFGLGGDMRRFGIVRLRWVPFGGHVKLKSSTEKFLSESECDDAYERQPSWVQALVALSACFGLFMAGVLILGISAWNLFLAGPWQFFTGALSPLSDAQVLIGDFLTFMGANGLLAASGFICVKFAAINLMPLPLLNGGDAILALTGFREASEKLELRLKQWSFALLCALYGSWLVAIGAYIWRAAD